MPNFFVKNSQIKNDRVEINGELLKHLRDSLRLKKGNRIVCIDEDKNKYIVIVTHVGNDMIAGNIIEKTDHVKTHDVTINLVQAIPKGPQFDFIIQKSTELGVSTITPVISERCVVRLDKEMAQAKLLRWRKIALEAAQQSNRRDVPEIKPPQTFNELLSSYKDARQDARPISQNNLIGQASSLTYNQVNRSGILPDHLHSGYSDDIGNLNILLWEGERVQGIRELLSNASGIKSVVIIIGPEGGFSEDEVKMAVEKGFTPVSLGELILRTETAPIVVLSIVSYELGLIK